MRTLGAGAIAWLWGENNTAEYNRITQSGLFIVDNEAIQGGALTSYATFRFNWVYDSSGLGLRFDTGESGIFGHHNNLHHNVVFRNAQGGLATKANFASTYRNTGIDNQGGSDVEGSGDDGPGTADAERDGRLLEPPEAELLRPLAFGFFSAGAETVAAAVLSASFAPDIRDCAFSPVLFLRPVELRRTRPS